MALAVAKAREAGIGLVTVRGSSDFAMASVYVLQALDAGLIGLADEHGTGARGPVGRARRALLHEPDRARACPPGSRDPIVIDMATSAYSMGAVVRAARDGRRLGPSAVVDAQGRYGDDPAAVILDVMARESRMAGALLPAGPKGFGWLLLVELLGRPPQRRAHVGGRAPGGPRGPPAHYGQTFVAIDDLALPAARGVRRRGRPDDRDAHRARPAEGFERVRLHGAEAAAEERRRRAHGIPVREEEWGMAERLAQRLGLGDG